jgi:hypothetical protein
LTGHFVSRLGGEPKFGFSVCLALMDPAGGSRLTFPVDFVMTAPLAGEVFGSRRATRDGFLANVDRIAIRG